MRLLLNIVLHASLWLSSFAQGLTRIRKEWSALTPQERKSYTDAVNCLMHSPSVLDSKYNSPSHFDDFLVVHINHTWHVHLNGYFLAWHRAYVHIYEDALQIKCDYKGMQPYWDWPKYFDRPLDKSILFDGSEFSLGSNGALDPSDTEGCIHSGPFTAYRVPYRVDDVFDALRGPPPEAVWTRDDFCLTRSLDDDISRSLLNQTRIDQALAAPNITAFRKAMDPSAVDAPGIGLHAAGHRSVGAQMENIFASPADPVFFLLHAQIDRLWTLWQDRDRENRVFGKDAVSGGQTMLHSLPTPNVTLEDWISFGYLSEMGKDRRVREVMDVRSEWLGYNYE